MKYAQSNPYDSPFVIELTTRLFVEDRKHHGQECILVRGMSVDIFINIMHGISTAPKDIDLINQRLKAAEAINKELYHEQKKY